MMILANAAFGINGHSLAGYEFRDASPVAPKATLVNMHQELLLLGGPQRPNIPPLRRFPGNVLVVYPAEPTTPRSKTGTN